MQKGESKPGSVPHLLPVIFQPMVFTLRKASASWPDSPEFWATSQHTYIDMQTHREGNNYFFVLHRLGLTFKEALRRKVKIHTICPQNHTVPSIFLVINLDRTYRKLEEKKPTTSFPFNLKSTLPRQPYNSNCGNKDWQFLYK